MINQPESCYVPVIEGSRWFFATYNVELGRPIEFFYFPDSCCRHDHTVSMTVGPTGEIEIEQDHFTGRYGECGANTVTVSVPVAVMAEFIRQIS
jgi:hypothetical protein